MINKFIYRLQIIKDFAVFTLGFPFLIFFAIILVAEDNIKLFIIKKAFKHLSVENKVYYINDTDTYTDIVICSCREYIHKPVPNNIFYIPKFIKELKQELGYINDKRFTKQLNNYDGLTNIKIKSSNIFFSLLKTKNLLLKIFIILIYIN